jgi:radical SAM superfamily enzyme YgiQ (UPF0313 family)
MKIALAAMSGIRVCDEELLKLGLTLPGFVERSKTIASLPSLGLLTLAGMTPARHELQYVEIPDLDAADRLPLDLDLVAISSYSAQIDEAYEVARRCRAAGVPVVIGGPHVSVLPEEALASCDAVVVGEGETSWRSVLDDCSRGRMRGIYGSLDDSFDMDEAPLPAFELLDISRYNRLTVQTSRGCPHRCEFCAGSVVLCPRYKQKPAGRVLAEIRKILEIWEHPFLEFADDNSFVNRKYWKGLLGELKGERIRWFAETDLSVSEDEALLDLMRASGCAQVLIGLESPVAEALRGVELRTDWKYKRWSRYREAIQKIQAHGISVNGCFVIGLDGHTPSIFDQVLHFVEASGLGEVQITVLTAFPGTPLYARLSAEGRILEDRRWDKCTLFDVNFRPLGMSPEELEAGFRNLGVRLYGDELTRRRRENFKKQLRERSRRRRGDRR